MESKPRSVLAAFQEHLQLASTKCGSLMEQLNIVRKKVEGKEAMTMNLLDPSSNGFMENVSEKTVLQLEEMDLLGHKDVLIKEQMAVDNAYVERSTGDMNCDDNKPLIIRSRSQHSETIINKEEVPFLDGNVTPNENERYALTFDGTTNHKRPEEKMIKETEKISGKSTINVIAGKDEESFTEDVSSDDESILINSCSTSSSSNDDGKEPSNNQNLYEELLKRLKDNEEKKNNNNNRRSSSENSSSTFKKYQETNKSPKKNSSNSTVNEDNFDKKNGDMENLDEGVEFFLPSSVTEKFQEMFYEESGEEDTMLQNNNKDKNMRVTFDDLIIGRPKKHSLGGDTRSENTSPLNRLLNESSIQTKVIPNQTNQQISNRRANGKVKEKNCDASSVKTKSEKPKKPNPTICSSTVMNVKLHSPEMNLYKRLNGVQLKPETKKTGGRKDVKSKKNTITSSRQKAKHIIIEPKLKSLYDKKQEVTLKDYKNNENEDEVPKTVNKTEEYGGEDLIVKNKNEQKNNFVAVSKNVHKKSVTEILTTNAQPKKVDEAKPHNIKRGIVNGIVNHKEEVKNNKNINSESKTPIIKKNHVHKLDDAANIKEKPFNSDLKNTVLNKNHVIAADTQSIPNEKLVKAVKKAFVKEIKPPNTKTEQQKKSNMRTLTATKGPSKNNSINEEISPINMKLKNKIDRIRPNTSALPVKKESNKHKLLFATRKEETFETRNHQPFDKISRTKEPSESLKGRHHLAREAVHSPSINEMKTHTASFPFILGQSTSKTYNVRAAIQQTMSMIMRSPAETLRRSSFSEMLNVSSKASTLRTSASCNSGRKVCPACVVRVDEEDNEPDDHPIDPWDTEYHSKRFIKCTCMPRNTVNFKTVMNQLLHETSSSYILPTESYPDSEVENGQDNRVNKSLFRKNNNIYKLSKLLHTLLKIRDLLVT